MIATVMSTTASSALLLVSYVAVGLVSGAWLARQGQPLSTAASAVALWPILLMVGSRHPEPRAAVQGPLAAQIIARFADLERTASDPAASDVPYDEDIRSLRKALLVADERLGLADRVLASVHTDKATDLQLARDRAAREIEGVLDGVTELQVTVGMLALSGNANGVRAELDALLARAAALQETAAL